MTTNMMRTAIGILGTLAVASTAHAQPTLLISQGDTFYRYQAGTTQAFHNIGDIINGMTTVPAGTTVGTLNGGAGAGDILALGQSTVYRVDNVLATPALTPIGARGGPNASPVFVGNRLFGIAGVAPQGSILVEWDPLTFTEVNRWTTGVFGGPGGIVAVPGQPNEFYYSEFNTDMLWHYRLSDTFSTPVAPTPNNDYVGLEMIGGTIYASYALPATGQFVLGTQALTGTFTQLAVLDNYGVGITGLAEIVPEPSTLMLLAPLAGSVLRRRSAA